MKYLIVLLMTLIAQPVLAVDSSLCAQKAKEKDTILSVLKRSYDEKAIHLACLDDDTASVEWVKQGYEFRAAKNMTVICGNSTQGNSEACLATFCNKHFSKVRALIEDLRQNCNN